MTVPILEVKGISKTFGKVKALDSVDFYLQKGVVHGLLGENGAGKSSLMNVLSGIYIPEQGTIKIQNKKIERLNPELASSLGIGMVHQEFRLIENFTIKDNLTLSKANIFLENFKEAYLKYSEIFSLNSSYNTLVKDLSVGEKQKVEIMKLIFKNSAIMLLDEPTAVLTPQETTQLKKSLETLSKEDEKTIVLITHKLKEIKDFTETIFVMKNGKMVAENLQTDEVSDKHLIELMMGEIKTMSFKKDNLKGETKLEVQNISLINNDEVNVLKDISFNIKSGEILGVAGVSGNGQVELSNVICGIQQEFNGKVLINSNDVSGKGVKSRKKLNLSYIPENRLGVGLAPGVSVLDNSAIREYFKASYGPHLSKGKMLNYLNDLIKQFSIKAPDVKAEISTLSGGNMQKLLMGRELISNPEVIVAAQPTRGLDVSAVESIHKLIINQRDEGSAVLLISEDLDELFKLSDRIIVLYEGRIIKEVDIESANIESLGLAMAGINE
jgi:simple sugar transport system ATP-binding protein|tara:strand:- start:7030 stop:8523 length:1494 start_codon:yes stop_codon:yes gene_type:complete